MGRGCGEGHGQNTVSINRVSRNGFQPGFVCLPVERLTTGPDQLSMAVRIHSVDDVAVLDIAPLQAPFPTPPPHTHTHTRAHAHTHTHTHTHTRAHPHTHTHRCQYCSVSVLQCAWNAPPPLPNCTRIFISMKVGCLSQKKMSLSSVMASTFSLNEW